MTNAEAYKWLYVHFAPCGDETQQDSAITKALEALKKQIPQKAMKSIDAYDKNLYKLYCPTCGALVAYGNSRVGFMNKVSKGYDRCAACGQAINWEGENADHE